MRGQNSSLHALALALALLAPAAQAPSERGRALELARAGRPAEAMAIFERIVLADPRDVEARAWVARLALRLGRTAEAEAGFRQLLREHPGDVDASIGLGMALTRKGAWHEALDVLGAVEAAAGENGDFLAATARAYRRGGDDARAIEYFRRARALSPHDADVVLGYEAVARVFCHWVGFEGFGQGGAEGTDTWSGALTTSARLSPTFRLLGQLRMQDGTDYKDALAGVGFSWRARRATTLGVHARGGSGNVSLARADVGAEAVRYSGAFEAGGGVRWLSFEGTDMLALSPQLTWDDGDRWRLAGRYTYSRSWFDRTRESRSDHSASLRWTWQGSRRVALQAGYAYGIPSFEYLTSDRVAALGIHTASAGLRLDLPWLMRVTTTWEHEWRSNDATVDRLTLSLVQLIP